MWAAPICVGVLFPKSPITYIFLRWSFWYIKLRVLIWFHLNPRNFNPRKIYFLDSFSFGTFFGVERRPWDLDQKMWNFITHLLIYVKSLSQDVHLLNRPRKSEKWDFPCFVPKKLVRVRYHWKWFFKLYNLSYSDSSFIRWVQKS